jgi:dephospho-CoA kinase
MVLVKNKHIAHRNGKSRPLRVAVTGNAGSGKTTVCRRLRELGMPVIVLDELARQAVAPGTPALEWISTHFGDRMLMRDGTLDRASLRRLILEDPEARRELERVLHPQILSLMHREIDAAARQGASVVAVEVPLLFECGLEPLFDCILLVTAEKEQLLRRVAARDRVAPADAGALVGAQMADDRKEKSADFIIKNDGPPSELIKSVDRFYQKIYESRK